MHRQIARAKARRAVSKQPPCPGDRAGYKALPQDSDEETGNMACRPCRSHHWLRWVPDSESDNFAMFVGIVITLNAIVLGLETDLGQDNFLALEQFFAVFFTLELVLRVSQVGCQGYFSDPSNCFDFVLVATGDFDLWFAPLLAEFSSSAGSAQSNATPKFVKLLRMFRNMRVVRLFKMFHELQIILEAFFRALHTVMWVGLIVMILNYMCAVFLTQTIGHNASMWESKEEDILTWFGSIGNSMRTLFIIITLAQWDRIALVVSEEVNGIIVFSAAIVYITVTAFTMVSLITGIISEELIAAQRDDELHKLAEIEKDKAALSSNVHTLLQDLDDDQSGALSEEEVTKALADQDLNLMTRLQALDIEMEMSDFSNLIKKMKDARDADEVPIGDIVESLKHLSGTATASSMWDVRMMLLQLQNEIVGELRNMRNEVKGHYEEHRKGIAALANSMANIEEKLEGTDQQNVSATIKSDKMLEQQDLLLSRFDVIQAKLMLEHASPSCNAVNIDVADVVRRLGSLEETFQSETGWTYEKLGKLVEQSIQVMDRQDVLKDEVWQELASTRLKISEAIERLERIDPFPRTSYSPAKPSSSRPEERLKKRAE